MHIYRNAGVYTHIHVYRYLYVTYICIYTEMPVCVHTHAHNKHIDIYMLYICI